MGKENVNRLAVRGENEDTRPAGLVAKGKGQREAPFSS